MVEPPPPDRYRTRPPLAGVGRSAVIVAASLVLAAYVLGPFVWLVSSSVQNEAEIVSIPPHWIPEAPTLENFRAIFGAKTKAVTYETRSRVDASLSGYVPSTARDLVPAIRNSLIVALAVVVLNLVIGVPAAYALAKIRFRGRTSSIYFILATRVIPDIVLVVPFFLFIRTLGLLDTLLSLVITYLAITIPFTVFILISYFESLPEDLDRAARVDGCSRFQSMVRVFLPLSLPSLVAVILFAFLASWNEFLLALMFTQSPASQTMPIVVASFTSDFTISFSFINAAGILAVVPPVILAIVFQRYVVAGLTAGAVKG